MRYDIPPIETVQKLVDDHAELLRVRDHLRKMLVLGETLIASDNGIRFRRGQYGFTTVPE